MEFLLQAPRIKPVSLSRSTGLCLLVAAAAVSGCNTQKTFAGLKPGETLTQGYVIDPQAIELVPVASSREQVLLARALTLAARGRPMGVIATELGYASASAFTAMVTRSVGMPPSRFFGQGA